MINSKIGVNPSLKETILLSLSIGIASLYLHIFGRLVFIFSKGNLALKSISNIPSQSHFQIFSFREYSLLHKVQINLFIIYFITFFKIFTKFSMSSSVVS